LRDIEKPIFISESSLLEHFGDICWDLGGNPSEFAALNSIVHIWENVL